MANGTISPPQGSGPDISTSTDQTELLCYTNHMTNSNTTADDLRAILQGKACPEKAAMYNGRVDMRGIRCVATPSLAPTRSFFGFAIERVRDAIESHGASVSKVDFSRSKISSIRLFDTTISNCVFDYATISDMRIWRTKFVECTFVNASLFDCALGSFDNGPNVFTKCSFAECDMTKTFWACAQFEQCDFNGTKLKGVDFGTSSFKLCEFRTLVKDVHFWHHSLRDASLPAAGFDRNDFSGSEIQDTGFYGVDLSSCKLPSWPSYAIVVNFRSALVHIIQMASSSSYSWRDIALAYCNAYLHRLGSKEQTDVIGILPVYDLYAMGSDECVDVILDWIVSYLKYPR
jgi:uncharacterized protein YjbI with pentapeptide repeats